MKKWLFCVVLLSLILLPIASSNKSSATTTTYLTAAQAKIKLFDSRGNTQGIWGKNKYNHEFIAVSIYSSDDANYWWKNNPTTYFVGRIIRNSNGGIFYIVNIRTCGSAGAAINVLVNDGGISQFKLWQNSKIVNP